MPKAYMLSRGGSTEPMTPVQCKDEAKELQLLLEKNYDLLPGEQIRPEDPRRWHLIKREMPVHDPGTGEQRWSIDHFFVDQDGIPTFVECKRYLDTRSRREVIGQMMEYAANGHYYWTKEAIRDLVAQRCAAQGNTLEEDIKALDPVSVDNADDFFELVENNLREGQIRLVFFLEEAPPELKSIVEFLNKQMERTEVLIVEAKQYEKDDIRVVVPTLFGYTEQARRIKKTVTVASGERRKWDEESFFEQARERLDTTSYDAVKKVYDFARSKGYEIRWGTGKQTGSLNIIVPHFFPKSLIAIFADGKLWLNFASMNGNETIEKFRDKLAEHVSSKLSISFPEDLEKRFPSVPPDNWAPMADEFISILDSLIEQAPKIPERDS